MPGTPQARQRFAARRRRPGRAGPSAASRRPGASGAAPAPGAAAAPAPAAAEALEPGASADNGSASADHRGRGPREMQVGGPGYFADLEDVKVALVLEASKANQLKAGGARNRYLANDEDGLCPGKALELPRRHFPERLAAQEHRPLRRWGNGAPIADSGDPRAGRA